jgi:hypothetical protein
MPTVGSQNTNATPPTAKRHDVEWFEVGALELDPENPRLPPDIEDSSPNGLLATLATEYDLTELGQSIAVHGYFSEEPLVVVAEDGRSIVVEGNRRLAALKLLDNPNAAPEDYRKRWKELSDNRKVKVIEVPVLRYETRPEVTPYLGYRHITGVLPWGPYQKARYIAQLVENAELSFADIARTIGSKAPTVREHYITFTLIRQSKEDFGLGIDRALEEFGVLRRALSDPRIRGFIGLNINRSENELQKPVPPDNSEAVQELFSFMFGDKDNEPVLQDSRQLTALGLVLSKPETVDALRESRSIDEAYRLAGGEEQLAINILGEAETALHEAVPLTAKYRESRSIMRAFERVSEAYEELAEQFPEGKRS